MEPLTTRGPLDDSRRDDEYRVVGDEFGEIFHRPPPAEQLEARMSAMCDFANRPTRQDSSIP